MRKKIKLIIGNRQIEVSDNKRLLTDYIGSDFYKILNIDNTSFYDFYRGSIKIKGKKRYYTCFILSKSLSKDMENFLLNQYKNIKLGVRSFVQAPELENNLIYLFDNCIEVI